MNLTALRYAVEVEKTGSISLAAKNLYLGQPNVSKAIKELENSMGITIFKRTSRGVLPTTKGEEFLHYAKSILSKIDELENLYQVNTEENVSFHVVVPRAQYITRAFSNFVRTVNDIPGMDLDLHEANAVDAITYVAQQEYNFGIIRYDKRYENHFQTLLGDKDLVGTLLWETPQMVLMSKNHPLAEQETLEIDQLADDIELIYGDNVVPFISNMDARQAAKAEENKRHIRIYESGSVVELLNNVDGAYMWSSQVPARSMKGRGLVQKECAGGPIIRDVLICQKDYRMKDIDNKFLRCLEKVRAEMEK